IEVEGATTCPAPADVAARLRTLIPDGTLDAGPPAARIRLVEATDGIVVEVSDASGNHLADRTIEKLGTCEELAAAAAVVAATHHAPLAFPRIADPSLRSSPPEPAPELALRAPAPRERGVSLSFAGGAVGLVAGDSVALGGSVEVGVHFRDRALGL